MISRLIYITNNVMNERSTDHEIDDIGVNKDLNLFNKYKQ